MPCLTRLLPHYYYLLPTEDYKLSFVAHSSLELVLLLSSSTPVKKEAYTTLEDLLLSRTTGRIGH